MNVAHVILIFQIVTLGFQAWTFYLNWKTMKILNSINKPAQFQGRNPETGDAQRFDVRRRQPPGSL